MLLDIVLDKNIRFFFFLILTQEKTTTNNTLCVTSALSEEGNSSFQPALTTLLITLFLFLNVSPDGLRQVHFGLALICSPPFSSNSVLLCFLLHRYSFGEIILNLSFLFKGKLK